MAGEDKVYFEHVRHGAAVKCSAVDSASGVEVSIVGPSSADRAVLETIALRKLIMLLARGNGTP